MDAQRYRIVLTGEIMEGYDADQASQALATLFRQPPDKLRRIFSGKSIPLNQEWDLDKARQVQARLHAAGAKCVVEPLAAHSYAGFSLEETEPPDKPEAPRELTCPKCGNAQEGGTECRRCGIVFSKWRPPAPVGEEGGAGLNEQQRLYLFVDANADGYLSKFAQFRAADGYALTWHWPAFFVAPLWAVYRKMWMWGALMFATAFVPFSGFLWALTADYIYFRHATRRLAHLGPRADEARIAEEGGTSPKAVWVAIGITLLFSFFVSGLLVRQAVEVGHDYAGAAAKTEAQAPKTPEGRKTTGVIQAAALMTNLWIASGRDPREVSLENLSADLQQPMERFSDGWGNLLRLSPTADSFIVTSAGPDGVFETDDDITFMPQKRID